jgi:hypothetical protein
LKPIGAIVAGLAYDNKVVKEAIEAIDGLADTCLRSLIRLGLTQGRAEELFRGARDAFIEKCTLCESPIEQIMLACLAHRVVPGTECFPPKIHDVYSGEPFPDHPVVIAPQFTIARYRLDFLVSVKTAQGQALYAIECDGKDYHSSIEQLAADKLRDDYLAALGIVTLRYSGQWIHRNKSRAADEFWATTIARMAA